MESITMVKHGQLILVRLGYIYGKYIEGPIPTSLKDLSYELHTKLGIERIVKGESMESISMKIEKFIHEQSYNKSMKVI